MKRMIVRLALAATVLTVTSVGLLVLRYHEMNEGIRALKQDNGTVAVEHLTPLARFGDRTAQYWLGSIYAFGWGGVAKNEAEATYWFQRHGLFGDPILDDSAGSLELNVATTYANGEGGVHAGPIESAKWLRLAAKAGNPEAVDKLKNN